jgi:hypothetical protein
MEVCVQRSDFASGDLQDTGWRTLVPVVSQAAAGYVVSCVAGFMDDLGSLDIERIGRWIDDTSCVSIPPANPKRGRTRILRYFTVIFRQYRELSWALNRVTVVGEGTAFVESTSKGIWADGRGYENEILTLAVYSADRKLILLSDYFKRTPVAPRAAR